MNFDKVYVEFQQTHLTGRNSLYLFKNNKFFIYPVSVITRSGSYVYRRDIDFQSGYRSVEPLRRKT